MGPEPVEGRLPAYVSTPVVENDPHMSLKCVRFDARGAKCTRRYAVSTHSAPSAERSCLCCFGTLPAYRPLVYSCGVGSDSVPGVAAAYAF